METISGIGVAWDIVRAFGPFGLIAIMWWVDRKDMLKERQTWLKEIQRERKANAEALGEVLGQYRSDMSEQRGMYKNNILLVKGYERISDDLQDVIIMNTTAMTKVTQAIETNQFCPMTRKNHE